MVKTRHYIFANAVGDGYSRVLHSQLFFAKTKCMADGRTRYVYRDAKEHWRVSFDEPKAEVFWEIDGQGQCWCCDVGA